MKKNARRQVSKPKLGGPGPTAIRLREFAAWIDSELEHGTDDFEHVLRRASAWARSEAASLPLEAGAGESAGALERAMEAAASACGCRSSDLKTSRPRRRVAAARKIAAWFMRKRFGLSLKTTCGLLRVHHSSVIWMVNQVDDARAGLGDAGLLERWAAADAALGVKTFALADASLAARTERKA